VKLDWLTRSANDWCRQ